MLVKVMSAHCVKSACARRRDDCSILSYVVQSSAGVSVRHHLNRSVHAFRDVEAGWVLDGTSTQAEVLRALLCEGGHQGDVEVVTWIVAKGEQDLDVRLGVTHVQLDGSTIDGELGSVWADSVLPTTGKSSEDVFVETASDRVQELEVCRDKRQQGSEEKGVTEQHLCEICGRDRVRGRG